MLWMRFLDPRTDRQIGCLQNTFPPLVLGCIIKPSVVSHDNIQHQIVLGKMAFENIVEKQIVVDHFSQCILPFHFLSCMYL